jgi:hypothetical protein
LTRTGACRKCGSGALGQNKMRGCPSAGRPRNRERAVGGGHVLAMVQVTEVGVCGPLLLCARAGLPVPFAVTGMCPRLKSVADLCRRATRLDVTRGLLDQPRAVRSFPCVPRDRART